MCLHPLKNYLLCCTTNVQVLFAPLGLRQKNGCRRWAHTEIHSSTTRKIYSNVSGGVRERSSGSLCMYMRVVKCKYARGWLGLVLFAFGVIRLSSLNHDDNDGMEHLLLIIIIIVTRRKKRSMHSAHQTEKSMMPGIIVESCGCIHEYIIYTRQTKVCIYFAHIFFLSSEHAKKLTNDRHDKHGELFCSEATPAPERYE